MKVAAAFLVWTAAATFSSPIYAQSVEKNPGDAGSTGYLALSLSGDSGAQSLFLDYARADGKFSQEVEVVHGLSFFLGGSIDFDDGSRSGTVYAKALPAGTYHFYRIAENDGTMVYYWRFSLPFTILPGRVTYVGNFNFETKFERWLGMKAPEGGRFSLVPQPERDLPFVWKKLKIEPIPVDTLGPDLPTGANSPFVPSASE